MNISVVIPLYNKAFYIKRAINSIINQIEPVDEIIVVNDGSTDGGEKIVDDIKNPLIRLINQKNAGQHAARNKGIHYAKNTFIGFLDADDEWKPDFITKIRRLYNNFPDCGAYATAAKFIKPDGAVGYSNLIGIPPEPWIGIIPNFFELFQHGYPFNSSSIVIPKKVLEEIGGFPENSTYEGDVTCWVKIAIRYPIAFSPSKSVIYHQEAKNRLGPNYGYFVIEPPFISLIQEEIFNKNIPIDLLPEVNEFCNVKLLRTAIQNILAGNPNKARGFLTKCRSTRKYKKLWYWWSFWSQWPSGWPLRLLKVKDLILGIIR